MRPVIVHIVASHQVTLNLFMEYIFRYVDVFLEKAGIGRGGRIIKRVFVNLLIIVLALMIQLIIPPDFIFKSVRPDFILIISVVTGLTWGVKYGTGFGFAAGLLQDLFLGGMFGIFTVIKTFTGGLSGFLEGIIFKEKIIFPPIIIFAMTIIHESLVILLSEKLIFMVDYYSALKLIILPEAILNAIIGFFIYYFYFKLTGSGGSYYE